MQISPIVLTKDQIDLFLSNGIVAVDANGEQAMFFPFIVKSTEYADDAFFLIPLEPALLSGWRLANMGASEIVFYNHYRSTEMLQHMKQDMDSLMFNMEEWRKDITVHLARLKNYGK